MSTQIITYVKQNLVIKFMKGIVVTLLVSIVINAFFLGQHVSSREQLVATQATLKAIAIESTNLRAERDKAISDYHVSQAKLSTALVPESTLKEAVSVHLLKPTADTATSAYSVVASAAVDLKDSASDRIKAIMSYVENR
jgi:hypothetical protein